MPREEEKNSIDTSTTTDTSDTPDWLNSPIPAEENVIPEPIAVLSQEVSLPIAEMSPSETVSSSPTGEETESIVPEEDEKKSETLDAAQSTAQDEDMPDWLRGGEAVVPVSETDTLGTSGENSVPLPDTADADVESLDQILSHTNVSEDDEPIQDIFGTSFDRENPLQSAKKS